MVDYTYRNNINKIPPTPQKNKVSFLLKFYKSTVYLFLTYCYTVSILGFVFYLIKTIGKVVIFIIFHKCM